VDSEVLGSYLFDSLLHPSRLLACASVTVTDYVGSTWMLKSWIKVTRIPSCRSKWKTRLNFRFLARIPVLRKLSGRSQASRIFTRIETRTFPSSTRSQAYRWLLGSERPFEPFSISQFCHKPEYPLSFRLALPSFRILLLVDMLNSSTPTSNKLPTRPG